MKAKSIILIVIVFAAATFMSFKYTEKFVDDSAPQSAAFSMPDNVKTIIDNKCYDCHSTGSKNKKGKMKLNFDKLSSLKVYKLVGKLDNISETVTEGEMPPKKAVAKYPDLKLTQEEITTLSSWADQYIEKLSGE